ncbi:MAG: signal recognition particle protein [Eggerthellaceae bacterium]|nr:signal recognition particle protein [Eggerthellaceae bacterium]
MFDNLQDQLQEVFDDLRGKGRLTEGDITAAMRRVRMALLEADVSYKVVKAFVTKTSERCMQADVLESLTPAQNVIKVVLDELTALLGESDAKLELAPNKHPNVIMLVGLQGSGKTTAAAKLAYLLKRDGHNPMLVACDVYRPAAADQLQTLGSEIGVRVYREGEDSKDPVAIAKNGVRSAVDNLCDIAIIDTAGRLHVDEDMMQEAESIKAAVDPDEVLMVVDAMTGQDVVNVVETFSARVDFDGVIMSKMDGDARGGGALSIRESTGKPIKFISSGEKPDSLEVFHPDRMARRILGMGDVVSLIESAVKVQQEEEEREASERLQRMDLNLNDFLDMNRQIRKMGGVGRLVSALPGGDKALAQGQVDERAFDKMETIINSMTKAEREKPDIINGSRRARIAAGAGVTVQAVNQLLKQYSDTRKQVKKMMAAYGMDEVPMKKGRPKKGGNKKGKNKKRRGGRMAMPGMGGMSMADLKKIQDMLG